VHRPNGNPNNRHERAGGVRCRKNEHGCENLYVSHRREALRLAKKRFLADDDRSIWSDECDISLPRSMSIHSVKLGNTVFCRVNFSCADEDMTLVRWTDGEDARNIFKSILKKPIFLGWQEFR